MNTPQEIVIHHSLTPRDLDLSRSLKSFERTHKASLHDKHKQPVSTGYYKHIAYHYVVGGDGTLAQTRDENIEGYHASNYHVNTHSIGICLLGNFDQEKPSDEQIITLKRLIVELSDRYQINEVSGHRAYAKKSCPGKNFTDEMIQELNHLSQQKIPDWAKEYADDMIRAAIKTLPMEQVGNIPVAQLVGIMKKIMLFWLNKSAFKIN